MDWELLMRIKPLFASAGAVTFIGLFIVIAILLVAAIKEGFTGG